MRLYANLRKYHPTAEPGAPLTVQLPEGARLMDLFAALKLPEDEVKMAFVQNRHQRDDYPLSHGDRVALFSPVAGG